MLRNSVHLPAIWNVLRLLFAEVFADPTLLNKGKLKQLDVSKNRLVDINVLGMGPQFQALQARAGRVLGFGGVRSPFLDILSMTLRRAEDSFCCSA